MENIARALIIAIQYLGVDRNDADYTEEDDLKVVEQTASILQGASEEEKKLLISVAKQLGLNEWAGHIGIEP